VKQRSEKKGMSLFSRFFFICCDFSSQGVLGTVRSRGCGLSWLLLGTILYLAWEDGWDGWMDERRDIGTGAAGF
jgi:hypothetical protein